MWAILYCILYNETKAGYILSQIKEEYFYEEFPRQVYLYVLELYQKGLKPDINILISKFPDTEIKALLSCNIDSELYNEYIEHLRDNYVDLQAKNMAQAILSKKNINTKRFLQYIDDLISVVTPNKTGNLRSSNEIIIDVVQEVNSTEDKKSKIIFGIESLDQHTSGLWPQEYYIIAGRPSIGKSGVLTHIAMTNGLLGHITALFSLEMSDKKIMTRMLSNLSNMELWKLKRIQHRKEEEQVQVMQAAEQLKKMPLFIETTPGLATENIQSVLQTIKLQYGRVDCIIIDYLQLMEGKGENDNSRVSNISKNLKQIAMQFNAPVIVGSQLSRLCESRDNKRPILSDLRDSGSIEQDADVVMMLYRDHYYNYNPENERILEILIRKFRNGEIGKILVEYNLKKQSLKPIDFNSKLGILAKKFLAE